uniref:Reverse transcriptase domain-containing protein n=2 Tax=Cannabis sativa TaxID=3483 RepID=A0A803QHM1_CANSA
MIRPFNKKDVKKALFSIHSSKSQGLEGFGSGFFKGLWSEIGDDITNAILDFFHNGTMPKEMNEMVIALISKSEALIDAKDYRLIACCNTIYKCVSKMLSSRMSVILSWLVNNNQGAFVKNWLLTHNFLIFQDVLKGYTRKNIFARCIIKIDLNKAYDNVD